MDRVDASADVAEEGAAVMSTPVPACFRGSLPISKAHEQGYKAGAADLSRDCNPYPFSHPYRKGQPLSRAVGSMG